MTSLRGAEHADSAQGGTGGDFVFTFSYESFADARKRGMARPPDRLVSTLISSPDVRRLLVADPYRSWITGWARGILDLPHRPAQSDRLRLVSPRRAARTDPTGLDDISRTYLSYEAALRRSARANGLEQPRFVTANPLVGGFARLDWTGPALYYARDDWLSSPARRAYWPAYREAYERMAQRGIAVAAVSQEIIDRIAPTGPHLVVPNGIEPLEWIGEPEAPPPWFAALPGPRAVYVGTLDSRLDVDGLLVLAAARPELQVVLIGPAPDAGILRALSAEPNIHTRGLLGRREVIAILRSAELTLLAHRVTALTEAMSPLKIYEYLAAGRPVLATDLNPVHGLGERVHLAPSVADFVDLVDGALAQGPAAEDERHAFIEANAWASRHRGILSLIGGL